MKQFKLINNVTGWVVFFIAAFTYTSTIEPTASWWDCGEYIAASYKLMVGHEPGAPTFQLVARVFSLLAGDDVTQVAKWVNIMSALASAFTILFLFWSITHFARKLLTMNNEELDMGKIIAVMGAGSVGALAYTFSDSFWFSAVEGEVYAMSSFFTALVFWAILKWDQVADERHADRWIILIALFMGLSIGVHLLNLLTIPAMTFVVYFRKFKPSLQGIMVTGVLSLVILVGVQYGIIPGIVSMASKFELMFVNGMGMPFNSGVVIYFLVLVALIIGGLFITKKRGMAIANTAILCFMALMIGYSTYTVTVMRSLANPPMDESNPEHVFALHSYLNREQYGDRPLGQGQYFNAQMVDTEEGSPVYYPAEDEYKISDYKRIPIYDKKLSGMFPRMYSNQPHHITEYKSWSGAKGGDRKPTPSQNFKFFWEYQMGHMYWRYFMWNFAGRQNDVQGHGELTKGNWISGILPLDESRLGPQTGLPLDLAGNKARNTFYLLPLLLGLFGMTFQFMKNRNQGIIVGLLFALTGIAIVIYLNQYPIQPRERDYAYVGSFYAFCIWIGLGVLWLYDLLNKKVPATTSAAIASVICLLAVPTVMAKEGWDDHDRSDRDAAHDSAINYLESCAPNAIIFTNGDNDTFPLWYAQEVEGVRTDVRVVNLSLFNTNWYVDQLRRKAYEADPLPFSFTKEQFLGDKRLQVPVVDRGIPGHSELKDIMNFVGQDGKDFTLPTSVGDYNYIPTKKVKLTIDSAQVIKTGTVKPEDAHRIVKEMKWNLKGSSITRNHLAVLDIIANNNWERPIYFAVTVGGDNYLGLQKYFRVEGLAYRLVPVLANSTDGQTGEVYTDAMFENMVNKFNWGNMHMAEVYHGTETERMSLNYRSMFGRLAKQLIVEGRREDAKLCLDRCLEAIPHESIPFNFSMIGAIEAYIELGEHEKAIDISNKLADLSAHQIRYYAKFDKNQVKALDNEPRIAMSVLQKLALVARLNTPDPALEGAEAGSSTPELDALRTEHFEQMDTLFLDIRDVYYDSPLATLQ